MTIRIYTPELELHLWVGANVSALGDFIQALQLRLRESGVPDRAPENVNRALVWACDAEGRCLAWFAGDDGHPPEVTDSDASSLIEGLEPPPLRAGVVVGAVHYGVANGDEGVWVPRPEAWTPVVQEQDDDPVSADGAARSILAALPPRRERPVEAPLSASMADLTADESDARMEQVLRLMVASEVGAIVMSEEADSGPAKTLGLTQVPDGRQFILVFADPWEFAHRYGVQFNATVPGRELLELLHADGEWAGLLLNSALAETSLIVTPAALELLTSAGEE